LAGRGHDHVCIGIYAVGDVQRRQHQLRGDDEILRSREFDDAVVVAPNLIDREAKDDEDWQHTLRYAGTHLVITGRDLALEGDVVEEKTGDVFLKRITRRIS